MSPQTVLSQPGAASQSQSRGKFGHSRQSPPRWPPPRYIRVIAVLLLVAFLATAATLLLLQSAGTIHLPLLGYPPGPVGKP